MIRGERYQPEIDGLRAVAILAAVFFHANVPGLAGGFIGVDVFFVLSGFLITRLLLAELNGGGRIDFVAFYARRARRILPALLLVVVVVLVLGLVVLSAGGEQQQLATSAFATLGFFANVYFWHTHVFYFAEPADRQVLLNMWTLSVEEQFYLVWPALLMLAVAIARWLRLHVLAVIAAILLALLAASLATVLWTAGERPSAAFYLTPPRVWELALGGALALGEPLLYGMKRWGGLAASIGLLAILVSALTVQSELPFSLRIIPAALGTTAVIAGVSANPQSGVSSILASVPLVVIGKLSYSWYLWHWPLLALARLYDFGHTSLVRDLTVVLVALGLAAFTYTLVENPVRRRRPWPFATVRQTLAASCCMSVAVAAIAVAIALRADARARRDPWLSALQVAREDAQHAHDCHIGERFYGLPPAHSCQIGEAAAPAKILLWGDSHAEHLVGLLRADGARVGYGSIVRTMSACPPVLYSLPTLTRVGRDCLEFNVAVAREIPALVADGLRGIVLSSRTYNFSPLAEPVEAAVWQEGIHNLLELARKSGLRVLMIGPIPTFPLPVADCLAHLAVARCGLSRTAFQNSHAPLLAALTLIASGFDNVRLLDLANAICNLQGCLPVRDGTIMLSDDNHLSFLGSRALASYAAADLDWLRQ